MSSTPSRAGRWGDVRGVGALRAIAVSPEFVAIYDEPQG